MRGVQQERLARRGRVLISAIGSWIFAWSSPSYGCGISWSVPVTYFDGVDERGHVCYSQQIGDLDLGDDLTLPLIINFRSDRENSSPYLGKGWILALLDSSFVQTDENTFLMTQPDGWVRKFYRRKQADVLLEGGGGWKAEIKENLITAYASCGWKLEFTKGRLTGMETPKSRHLKFVFSGNKTVELREGDNVKLSVSVDPSTGEPNALLFNKQRLTIARAEKPRVQSIAGQSVLSGVDRALKHLSGNANVEERYYAFSVNDKVQPTFKITEEAKDRIFTWDSLTKQITADGDWKYDISPGPTVQDRPTVGRTNPAGLREYRAYDAVKGQVITQTIDGTTIVKTYFASGVLGGKLRRVEQLVNGRQTLWQQLTYDELGRPIRELNANGTVELFSYSPTGQRLSSLEPRPTTDELKREERRLLEEVNGAPNKKTREEAIFGLVMHYVDRFHDSAKGRETAGLLQDPQRRFTAILESYDHDSSLAPKDKITKYEELLQQFPNQSKILSELIEIRKKEL